MPDSAAVPVVFVVIAAYNEGTAIGDVVSELRAAYSNVVVVDDGSVDATSAAAEEAGAIVLRHIVNRGQGAALQTGLSHARLAGADVVVTFDADGQHRVADIESLLGALAANGGGVALGSRFLGSTENMSLGRRALLKGAVLFSRVTSGLPVTDAHNGLRALSSQAVAHIHLRLDRMAHASEFLDQIRRSGVQFTEVPVHIRYTDYSKAKGQGPGAAIRILFDYLMARLVGS